MENLNKIAAWNMLRITNEKIIRQLGITVEEVAKLRIGHNKKLVEERKNRQFNAAVMIGEIEDMYAAGKTVAEIAKEFPQISKRTIQRYIAEYRKRKQSPKQKQELANMVLEMYQETTNLTLIARRTKCSVDTVRQTLNLQGMTEITKQETKRTVSEPEKFISNESRKLYRLSVYKTEQTEAPLDEYNIALATLRIYKNAICILGPGGCGKTHLIKEFLAALSPKERAATLIVAPTGKAADNLDAQTIHKAFQFPNEVQPNEEITAAPKHLFSITRIIIDEINMVRQDVFSRLIKTIRFVEQQTHRQIQVIVLGDFGQIQPVTTAADMELLKEFYPEAKGVYAFHSDQWAQMNFRKIVLKHIYRQDDPVFKEKLNEIKYGNAAALQWFNENSNQFESVTAITICPTNKLVDYYNKEAWYCFDFDTMVEYVATYKKGCSSEELPCPETLQLATDMRVMTVCNGDKYKNGSIGTIIKTNKSSILVQFDNGIIATVGRHRFMLQDGGIYEQIPVVLAYAITANKSEGMTFKEVNIVPGFFAPGQLYTALSRCTSVDGIYIHGELTPKDLHVDIEALRMTIDEA
jgi:ATP-dependent exoDNAse (exonuclease V) alpha subunit